MNDMHQTLKKPYLLLLWLMICFCIRATWISESIGSDLNTSELKLVLAAMCEHIKDYSPVNQSVVFSVSIGKISCFTRFDPVPKKTQIEHRWYYKDTLTTKKKLFLRTPRWSTYSSIQLRDVDKGPWRVEIVDQNNHVLDVLRFSVTD